MSNPFRSICACCRSAPLHCAVFTTVFMCLFFAAIALHFPVVSQVIECTAFSVPFCFLCILSVSKQKVPDFCTISFPPPPILMGVKGELSKGPEVCICMSMGERGAPMQTFFIKLNLISALKLV